MRTMIIAAMAASVALSGCTNNPYTNQSQASKAAWGAGIGVLTGAALGAATGDNKKDRRERALRGAAIGGVVGGGVGAYMDVQEKKLREKLQGSGVGVQIAKASGTITLIMPGNITFPTGQSSIKPDFFDALNSVALVLKEYNKTSVTVAGFTDNVGKDDFNMKLSQDRASSVSQYLASQGVAGSRLNAVGMGKAQPVADNATEVGRAQNRRVEIKINAPESV